MRILQNGIPIIKSHSCTKRKQRMTKEEAETKAKLLSGQEGWKYNSYYCNKCNTYHVGHCFPRERTYSIN